MTKKIRARRSMRNWNTKNYYTNILRNTYNIAYQDAIAYRQLQKRGDIDPNAVEVEE